MEELYKEIHQALASTIKGTILPTNEGVAAKYYTDFGSISYKQPKIIVQAICEQDICHTLKIANTYNKKVTIRGAAHSVNGQTVTDEILLINYCPDQEDQIVLLEDDLVQTPTCVTWGTLEKKLNQYNRSCPVLTDNLISSIGGTLSICGIGERSIKNGTQIDQIVRLKMILPDGRTMWCSENENSDLFKYSIGSLGSLGVIATVVMKTIPRKTTINHSYPIPNKTSDDLDNALNKFIQITQHQPTPDCLCMALHFEGVMKDFSRILYGYEHSPDEANTSLNNTIFSDELPSTTEPNHCIESHNTISTWCKQFTDHKKIWIDYFFNPEQAKLFMQKLKSTPMAPYLSCLYFVAQKRPAEAPVLPLHPLQLKNKLYISIGGYFHIAPNDEKGLLHTKNIINELTTECLAIGGKPYLYGTIDLNNSNIRTIYGNNYDELIKMKHTYDPKNTLSSPLINIKLDNASR
ncbi:MAG: FAD-binding oxidoreductase [Rickettsiales bacterium]